MRACHPDVAGASVSADEEDDGSADDVCVFINAAVMEVKPIIPSLLGYTL